MCYYSCEIFRRGCFAPRRLLLPSAAASFASGYATGPGRPLHRPDGRTVGSEGPGLARSLRPPVHSRSGKIRPAVSQSVVARRSSHGMIAEHLGGQSAARTEARLGVGVIQTAASGHRCDCIVPIIERRVRHNPRDTVSLKLGWR